MARVLRLFAAVLLAATIVAGPATAMASAQGLGGLAGIVFDTTFYSPILGREMPYRIYLPPGYLFSEQRYPVLYMLHGAGGNYTEWSDSFLPQRLDAMIVDGSVQPMIVVMPEGGGRTYFANWDRGPRYSDYVAYDVVSEIDLRYRTVSSPVSRAIGGLSMGGLAALQIAMRHPHVFGVAGGHSPSIRLEPDPELWFLSDASFREHDPIWLARNSPGVENLVYWLDVGGDDWWRPNIEELRTALVSAGLLLEWHVLEGTHEADYWIAHVPDYLRFYSDNLRA